MKPYLLLLNKLILRDQIVLNKLFKLVALAFSPITFGMNRVESTLMLF
jgi:hypothetical protein